jgi:release factor glutamine methyltransferase
MIGDALGAAVDAMKAAGVETPRLDAELLLAAAIESDRSYLASNPEAEISPAATRRFAEMVRRRLRREPVAYILGRRGFRHLELAVDPRVLIPRPETELLVGLALELRPRTVLDVGTGSGALALAIAAELPGAEVTATDTSTGALAVAAANAERLGLAARVELFEGSLPPRGKDEEFDLVVANLPYVSERDWGDLQREVTKWEPREALLAGPEGLDVFRTVVPSLAAVTGTLALEIGQGQSAAVGELLRAAGCQAIESRRDLAGIERIVIGRRESVA